MSLLKNGLSLPFMTRTEGPLLQQEIAVAVNSMSYEGLQMAAALGLVFSRTMGLSPARVNEMLVEMTSLEKTA